MGGQTYFLMSMFFLLQLPKFDMEPDNDDFQKESPISGVPFSGPKLRFGSSKIHAACFTTQPTANHLAAKLQLQSPLDWRASRANLTQFARKYGAVTSVDSNVWKSVCSNKNTVSIQYCMYMYSKCTYKNICTYV